MDTSREVEVAKYIGLALFNLSKGKAGNVRVLLEQAYEVLTGNPWDTESRPDEL